MKRRQFLKTSAAALAALTAANRVGAYVKAAPKKRVGLIGCGWYGKCDLWRLNQVEPIEIVSLCDVDTKMLREAAEMASQRHESGKTPRTYADHREMLKEKDLDIVLIGTPDHWHALTAIAAIEAGADLYLQKPISADVIEGEAILAAARKHGRVVQVGTQRRSTPHLIEARDKIVKTGMLGKIGLVEIYCYYHMRVRGQFPPIDPPENLDWDAWTGPAPMRPYHERIHPGSWRSYKEYGNGILGDMCIHMYDMTRWMLDLGWPSRISSSGGIFVDKDSVANVPDTQTATFEFPQNDLNVVWQHRTWGSEPDRDYPWGATFYGEKGTLKLSVHKYDFIPRGNGEPLHGDVVYELEEYPEDKTEKRLETHVAPAIRLHMKNLLEAIANRGRPVADIEQGHISTASCILANMSLELGRTLSYDPKTRTVVDDEEATKMLRRPYRNPWIHPEA
jgi:predicted dehydrogenase